MSKKNEKDENKSGKSRRDFIRNAALGAAGLTLGLSLAKGNRVLAKFAARHSEDFFGKALATVPNRNDEAAFTNVFNDVNAMVESNPEFRANVNRIFNTITTSGGPFDLREPLTGLGLHTDTTNLLATGYLGALSSLRVQAPSRDQITGVLSDPSSVNRFIEAGFVNSLYRRANEEVGGNGEFARNTGSAVEQLQRAAGGGEGRQPCTVPTYTTDIYGNQVYVGETPCWVVVVVVVIVIIAIILK